MTEFLLGLWFIVAAIIGTAVMVTFLIALVTDAVGWVQWKRGQ